VSFAAIAHVWLWHWADEPGCPHSRRVLEGKRTNHGRWKFDGTLTVLVIPLAD